MDKMTFEKYIHNPTGSRSRLVGEADVARSVYGNKYNNMILRCAGNINYVLWVARDKSRYIIYLQMPSETVEKLYYDVVVEFTTDDDVEKRTSSLKGYHVRFFSNDPSFTFTYAHAYNKRGLLIPDLKSKVSPKALKQEPKVTNPNMLAGYVKSLYFAYIYMNNKGLMNKLNWIGAHPISDFKPWASKYIMNSDKKYLYAQNFRKVAKQKKVDGSDPIRVSKTDSNERGLAFAAKTVDTRTKYSDKIGRIKKANTVRTTRNSKVVKIIGRR